MGAGTLQERTGGRVVKSPRNPHLRGMCKMALKPESKLARWRGRGEEPPRGTEQRLESKRELDAFEEVKVTRHD